ncbi:MAG: pilus assembly protein TadG-related protein [Pseudomonadota bacterium]
MNLNALSKRFVKEERGYVAAAFAILLLPILAIVGGAIDYRNVGREYAGLRTAAEAAAVAVARSQFKFFRPGHADPVENPLTVMKAVFETNYPDDPAKYSYVTPTLTYVDPDEKAVTVTAKAGVKTSILQLIGFNVLEISAEAKAGAYFSDKNVEIHFVMDMSPSMGSPADGTPPPVNAAGCFFMCHDDGSTIRNAGKTPKMDVVRSRIRGFNGVLSVIHMAAVNNPIPITINYTGHYFDHHLHAAEDFSHTDVATARLAYASTYELGRDGIYGGTDLKTSFQELHDYFVTTSPLPANTRRVIVILSDGMHSRAKEPFDPAVCTSLKNDGDVFTFYIKNPDTIYDNPNFPDTIPNSSTPSRNDWDWMVLRNGGENSSGYFSGLNNASLLMKNCASQETWAFVGETQDEITANLDAMAEAIIAPDIRVIN